MGKMARINMGKLHSGEDKQHTPQDRGHGRQAAALQPEVKETASQKKVQNNPEIHRQWQRQNQI